MTERSVSRRPAVVGASVVLLVLAAILPTVAGAASAGADIAITDVSVSTQHPTPGQLTEIRTSVRNTGNRSGAVEITDVFVRPKDESSGLARAENLGTVTAGQGLTVPLTVRFDEPGVKDLRVYVVGRTSGGEFVRRQYPLTVVVDGDGPGLNIDVANPSVGGETAVSVNVTNGATEEIRDVRLSVSGSNVEVENPERIAAVLGSGAERSFAYTATFAGAPSTLTAELRYTTREGQTRTVSERATVGTERLSGTDERPQVEVSVPDAVPGATRPVNVTVANGLDDEVRQLRVVADSPTASFEVEERVRATLAAGEDVTLRFPASVDESGTYPVNVTLAYTHEGVHRRVTRTLRTTFGAPANPAEVALTGTEAVSSGGSLEISATAGNVGSTAAEGVVVSVGDAPKIGPAEYFVGSVDASDFASFTLRTSLAGNVSSVPLYVRYVVDGVERTYTTEVPVEQRTVRRPERGSGGGLPLVPAAGAVVLLAVLGVGYRVWR
jgi:hypothetical protein